MRFRRKCDRAVAALARHDTTGAVVNDAVLSKPAASSCLRWASMEMKYSIV